MAIKKKGNYNLNLLYIGILVVCIVFLCISIHIYKTYPNSAIANILRPMFEEKPDIILDAGHGGYDKGSGYNGIYEKDVALKLTLDIGGFLEKKGLNVKYTRDSDNVFWPSNELKDLEERTNYINQSGARYFVSIHTNATKQKTGQGFEIWTDYNNENSLSLAKSISSNVETLSFVKQRGIKNTSSFYIIKHSQIPGILVEAGFLESKNDREYLLDERKRLLFAERIAKGIIDKIKRNVE